MVVSVQHRLQSLHPLAHQLQPQLRRGVNEDVAFRGAEKDGTAVAVIRGSVERQTSQEQPTIGTPTEVPVPRKVKVHPIIICGL